MKQSLSFVRTFRLFSYAIVCLGIASLLTALHLVSIAHLFLYVATAIAIIPMGLGSWQAVRNGTFDVALIPIGTIVTALILKKPWVAIAAILAFAFSKLMIAALFRIARHEAYIISAREPQVVHGFHKQKAVDVPVNALAVRDKFTLIPGDIVPADAYIIEGSATFDTSMFAPGSEPAPKTTDEYIASGWRLLEGAVTAQAVRTPEDSFYQRLVWLLHGNTSYPAPFVRLTNRYSLSLIALAFAIAGLSWTLSHQTIRFLDVLAIATPAALTICPSLAFTASLSRAARDGIYFKTGAALEQLANTQTVAFDKIGTLTAGSPTVSAVIALQHYSQQEVLTTAAALAAHQSLPLFQALVIDAAEKGYKKPKIKHIQLSTELGLTAHLGAKPVLLGSSSFIAEQGIGLPANVKPHTIAQSALFLAIDGNLAGYIILSDSLRKETRSALQDCKRMGVAQSLLLTSDHRGAARAIAKQLHITTIQPDASLGNKLQLLDTLTERPIVYVGSQASEAPLLTAADVGILLNASYEAGAAGQAAGVLIASTGLSDVTRAIAIARRTLRISLYTISIGAVAALLLMAAAAIGLLSPFACLILQVLVTVTSGAVALSGRRAIRQHGSR